MKVLKHDILMHKKCYIFTHNVTCQLLWLHYKSHLCASSHKKFTFRKYIKVKCLVLNWCLPICNKLNITWLLILEIQNFSSSVEKYFTEQILDVSLLMLPIDSILFHLWGTRQISMAAGLTKRATYLHTSADDNLFSIHSHQVKKDLPPQLPCPCRLHS